MEEYTLEDRTIDLVKTNLIAIPLFVVALLIVFVPFIVLYGSAELSAGIDALLGSFFVAMGVFVLSIVIHEALHGIGWMLFGGIPLNEMKFGVQSLTPYAHSKQAMPARGYRIGAALPGVVLGVLPAIFGVLTGNGLVAFYGAMMLGTAGGDALILWMLRDLDPQTLVQDHPSEAGAQVLHPMTEA
jgi:hypothetical protein